MDELYSRMYFKARRLCNIMYSIVQNNHLPYYAQRINSLQSSRIRFLPEEPLLRIVNYKRQTPYSFLYFHSSIHERTAPNPNSNLKSSLNVFLLIGEGILFSIYIETVALQQCNDLKKNLSWPLCHLNYHVTPSKGKKTAKKLATDSFLL